MQNSISQWQRMLLQEIEEKELSPKQQKIAKLDPPADKIDAGDFEKLRAGAKIEEKVDMAELEFELKRLKKENPGKKVTYTFKQDSPKGYVFFIDKKLVKEGGDHEVSMANNSIETIIKHAMDLKAKLGNEEKDIPAWIQDHITNAANFISQAAENYHEYGDHEAEKETEDSLTSIMEKIIKNGHK
tara:strand:- start:5298 stop:5855 length:558 start_codon:yes stop_codon:yes gene_type:complete